MKKPKFITLGISAGNGACLFPFKDNLIANIEVRAAFKTPDDNQWKLNFKKTPLYTNLPEGKLPRFKDNPKIDLIIGHPDCGHSSKLRFSRAKELSESKDSASLQLYFKAIQFYQPKFFLFENLSGLLKEYPINELHLLFNGYILRIQDNISVSKFGNSQKTRKRLIIVGIRKDIHKNNYFFDFKPFKVDKVKKCKNLLKGYLKENPEIGHVREPLDTMVCMYKDGRKLSLKEVYDLWNGEYKDLKRWPMPGTNMKTLPGVYRDFGDQYPSTVRKQNRAFNRHGLVLSPRETGIINGIPVLFKLDIPETCLKDKRRLGFHLNKARVTTTKTFPMEISIWLKKSLQRLNYQIK